LVSKRPTVSEKYLLNKFQSVYISHDSNFWTSGVNCDLKTEIEYNLEMNFIVYLCNSKQSW